jgi:hypothetical protein
MILPESHRNDALESSDYYGYDFVGGPDGRPERFVCAAGRPSHAALALPVGGMGPALKLLSALIATLRSKV